MNISKETISQLEEAGYTYFFNDENFKDFRDINKASEAVEITICSFTPYCMKTIKATKKETTFIDIMKKINKDVVYKNFCKEFDKLFDYKAKMNFYPTSYGIGVWVPFLGRKNFDEIKKTIEDKFKELNIEFKNEYSDANWVFRYKISKHRDNIAKIKNFVM